jgi:hypothetical protein
VSLTSTWDTHECHRTGITPDVGAVWITDSVKQGQQQTSTTSCWSTDPEDGDQQRLRLQVVKPVGDLPGPSASGRTLG